MQIDTLKVQNFKNAELNEINFSEGINVIYGENASGKTNLLEAIFFFASSRSFRGCKEREMIRFGENFAQCEMQFQTKNMQQKIGMRLVKNQRRQIFVNGIKVQKISEYLGLFRSVIFTPDHLNLVKGSAPFRRKFLDIAICQSFPRYVVSLNEYQKILMQKNALLKTNSVNRNLLEVYNERLASLGGIITLNRSKYIHALKENALHIQDEISNGKEILDIRYISQANCPDATAEEIKAAYEKLFREKMEKEIAYGGALIGIQKDDFEVFINEKSARIYGSQGQQRSVVLALKLAEGELSQQLTGEYPVFLLDDVLSELDSIRREYVLGKIPGKQVVITGCEPELFSSYQNANKIFVCNGKAENV